MNEAMLSEGHSFLREEEMKVSQLPDWIVKRSLMGFQFSIGIRDSMVISGQEALFRIFSFSFKIAIHLNITQ